MKQLLIPIQSFSNIITNSSSEIFCIINGDKETILFINNLLFNLLGKNVYDEDYDCWILYGYDFDNYPKGAYWENELGRVVFGDIYSLINFAINH